MRLCYESLLIMLWCFLLGPWVYGYEVDNFTKSDQPLADSREILNQEVDRRLQSAIEHANDKMDGLFSTTRCDVPDTKPARVQIFESLNAELTSGYLRRSGLEGFTENDLPQDHRLKVENKDSIYKGADSSILKNLDIASVIRIAGVRVGTDKLGHFFKEGFIYYDGRGQGEVELVRRTGAGMEKSFTGKGSTGVLSFADLAANYDGFRFWSRILGEGISPCEAPGERAGSIVSKVAEGMASAPEPTASHLSSSTKPEPYICCQDGKFQRNPNVAFDFADYISLAWDESVNCSRFSPDLETVVSRNLQSVLLANSNTREMKCPRKEGVCKGLISRYKGYAIAIHILHDSCICQDDPTYKACRKSPSSSPSSTQSVK